MRSKYIYVMYPGGCGGSHICNMISLCDGFAQRTGDIEPNCYKEWMLKQYIKTRYIKKPYVNAHFSLDTKYVDVFFDNIDKEYAANPDCTLIVQGHLPNFLNMTNAGILETLGNEYIGIVMNYPSEGSMPFKRIEAFGFNHDRPLLRDYDFPFVLTKTSSHNREIILKIDDTNGFYLDTEKFFTSEGSQYLRGLMLAKFNVELPPEADELHKIWFKWMDHVCSQH